MTSSYDLGLVALSICVAMLASFVALDLTSRIASSSTPRAQRRWLVAGALSMGTGIWAMHFIGMLALRLPIAMSYDVGITALSLLIAIAVSAFALQAAAHPRFSTRHLLLAGASMGAGISAMHYTGMAAMKLQPPLRYDPVPVVVSVIIAIAASLVALQIALRTRSDSVVAAARRRICGALLMGLGIAGMHYTGMAAAEFAVQSVGLVPAQHIEPDLLAASIGGLSAMLMAATLLLSLYDARAAARSVRLLDKLGRTNAELRASEQRYRDFADASPEAIFIHQHGRIVFANRAMAELVRARNPDELIGEPANFTLDSESIVTASSGGDPLRGDHGHLNFQQFYKRRDGSTVPVDIAAAAMTLDGEPASHVTVRDVSERYAADSRVRTALERFELVARATNDAVWDWDLRENTIWWSGGMSPLFGYESADIGAGVDWWHERIHPDDLSRVYAGLCGAIDGTANSWSDEYLFRHADGTYVEVWDRGYVMRDETGRAVRMLGALADISERKRMERTRANWAAVVESADDAIICKSLDGVIQSWNPGATRLFGYTPDEIIGESVTVLIPSERLHEEAMILARIARGDHVKNYESRRRRKDGSELDVSLTISPIYDAAGIVVGASKIVRDVSDRVAAERRERRLTDFYTALSRTNAAIVRVQEPAELFQEICNICVEFGHANMAFIATIEEGKAKPVAWAGPRQAYTGAIEVPLDSTGPDASGPIAIAIREQRPYICNDFFADPCTRPWREQARLIGTRGLVVFPFRQAGRVTGVLTLHVAEANFFDDSLIALLDEMAMDISFALDNHDRRLAQRESDRQIRLATDALRMSEGRFRTMLGNLELLALMLDPTGRVTYCNDYALRVTGWTREELVGRNWFDLLIPPEIRDGLLEVFAALLDGAPEAGHNESEITTKQGERRLIRWNNTLLRDPHNEIVGSASIGEDVTEQRNYEARIEYLAAHDGLTGLPNRSLMHDRITQEIAHARRRDTMLAVLFIDLDRFKVINDGFGHPFGDSVIKATGERLATLVREGDTVARHGGDEFLMLLTDLHSAADVFRVTQQTVAEFERPFLLDGREIYVTASIGVSLYPDDGATAETLIRNADVAMYRSKELGRNTCQFFTREMSEETQRRVELETALRAALAHDELSLVYQPKIDLATRRITGCEALLRWEHPTLGEVSPARFIPIAEDSGLIAPIGDWVLRTACAQCRAWHDAGLGPLVMSVNVSARQFLQQDVAGWALSILRQSGLAPEFLELELTESLIAQDVEKVVATLGLLHASGLKLSIDDFGTGYSSLSYLKRFRVDTLKIDQSFIRDMLTDPDDATIALAVISLAHSLNFRVIAEGVESAEHCRVLGANGCDEIQGYYVSKAVPAAEFAAMLSRNTRFEF